MAKSRQQKRVLGSALLIKPLTLVRCFAAFMVLVFPIHSGDAEVVAPPDGFRVKRDVETSHSSLSMQRHAGEGIDKTKYTLMAVTGAAMVVVGTTFRFGEETVRLSSTSASFVEKSYNGANYA